jgi:superfamily II DNA helicase RecQ
MCLLFLIPTGYGKSLIFQLLPDIYDIFLGVKNSIVLVISPLNALMQDQVIKLNERGISACMIQGHGVVFGKDDLNIKLPLDELANPTFQLLYMHPEVCVYEKKVTGFFNSVVYQERVRCVVVDEAHLVLNWYVFPLACTKRRNVETKRPKRNGRNHRNDRNETKRPKRNDRNETTETTETKRPKI